MENDLFQFVALSSSAVLLIAATVAQIATKSRRAVAEFAKRSKLTCRSRDEGDRLARRLREELDLPAWGPLRQIVVLESSIGDGYFFTRYPRIELPRPGGGPPKIVPRHFLVIIQPLPLSGRVLVTPKPAPTARFAPEFLPLLAEAFGNFPTQTIEIESQQIHLKERFEWHAEQPEDVSVLLGLDRFPGCMLKAPTSRTGPLIAFGPSGIAIDINPRLLRRENVERHVAFAEELSRCLAKKKGKAGASQPPPAMADL